MSEDFRQTIRRPVFRGEERGGFPLDLGRLDNRRVRTRLWRDQQKVVGDVKAQA